MSDFDLVVTGGRVVTCDGPESDQLGIVEDGCVAVRRGRIAWVGPSAELGVAKATRVLDAGGRIVMPGLVDPHTHLVFAGSRVDEFARRTAPSRRRAAASRPPCAGAARRRTRSSSTPPPRAPGASARSA